MNVRRLSETELSTLVSFLVDSNPATQRLAHSQLRSLIQHFPDYLPLLETINDPGLARAAMSFVAEFKTAGLEEAFRQLGRHGDNLDLEKGVLLLAQSAYPTLRPEKWVAELDTMAAEVEELFDWHDASPEEEVGIMRRYLFDEKGFTGNVRQFYDPDNSYLNKVLERRLGIPISLSVLYLFLGWRLELPVHGVGLPGHFLVGHQLSRGVLFLDPFNKGRLLSQKDCEELVRRHGVSFKKEFLSFAPSRQILSRMMVNLINLYTDRGEMDRAQLLTQLLQHLQDA